MQDINMVVITGGLTKDAVIRNTQNGAFYSFSIGFTKSEKDKNGNWNNKSLYRDCSFFSKGAFWPNVLKKGTKLCIKGRLDTSEYTDPTGEQKKKDFIWVEDIQVFSSKKEEQKPAPVQEPEPDFTFPDEYDAPTF